jgi:hypothetical protein
LAAKRKKKKNRKPRHADEREGLAPPGVGNSRGVEALTVLWMLTVTATVAALLAAGAVAGIAYWSPGQEERPTVWTAAHSVLLFTALTTGTLCLVLMPLITRLRHDAPPRGILWIAIIVGISPWAVLAWARMTGQ